MSLKRNFFFKIEKTGYIFILISIGIGLSALNSGNNLLYFIFSTMMVFLVISGILSTQNLSRLKVKIEFPSYIFAQRTAYLRFKILNKKRLFPSFSIKLNVKVKGLEDGNEFLLYVGSKNKEEVLSRKYFPRRGLWKITGYYISSTFPFNLFERKRFFEMEEDIIVYPKIVDLFPHLPDELFSMGEIASKSKGYEEDFFGLRDWKEEDDKRYIHWKITAKKGKLIIKELAQPKKSFITLIVDPYLSELSGPKGEEQFEENISLCASLAYYFFNLKIPYKVLTPEYESEFDTSESHFWENLKALALLRVWGKDSIPILENFSKEIFVENSIPILFSVEKDSPLRKNLPKYYEILTKRP